MHYLFMGHFIYFRYSWPGCDYFKEVQVEVKEHMRKIVADWMLEVSDRDKNKKQKQNGREKNLRMRVRIKNSFFLQIDISGLPRAVLPTRGFLLCCEHYGQISGHPKVEIKIF